MKPTCFEDIIAAISLYRPGPMESIPRYIQGKQNPSSIHYETEKLRPILDFVDGASGIARNLGVSESVIGLTLVAGGTSLPELATSIVAALKKNPEIAIGNVIGSNLFNIFFVLGCSASITPLHLTGITNMDLLVLVGSSILLWIFGLFFAKRTITRIEGSILILCYIAYTTVLIYNV